MKLKNIGGATAILEHRGKRMLFDPWMDDGIFHGSWYHYPPSKVHLQELGRLDYVYISHIHEDHCSAGTLRHINPDAEIILMDREPNLVAKFLDAHGFHFRHVHLIRPRTPTEIAPGLIIDMVEPDPADEMSRLIDSSMVINWDGFVVYNANDCLPYSEGMQYILDRHGRVDLALLPYSGGSGYPACYLNLDDKQKQAEKKRIMDLRLQTFIDATRYLQPRYVMPFADQYVVGGSRAGLNSFVSHPSSPAFVQEPLLQAELDSVLLLLNSGQIYDFEAEMKIPDEVYRVLGDDERERYIASHLKDAKYDHERFTFSPSVPLARLVEYARARMWQMQERKQYYPAHALYLETNDSCLRFHLPLDSNTVSTTSVTADCVAPYLRIVMPHSLLIMLLIGHVSWNIADAALFLDYERIPNTYDPMLYAFLNYLRI